MGVRHPDIAKSLHGLATLYQIQAKYDQAEPLYQRALAIRQQRLGPTHPKTQETQSAYATLLRLRERDAETTAPDTNHRTANRRRVMLIDGRPTTIEIEALRYTEMSQNERKFVDMTSLTVEEFNQLVPTFENAFQERTFF